MRERCNWLGSTASSLFLFVSQDSTEVLLRLRSQPPATERLEDPVHCVFSLLIPEIPTSLNGGLAFLSVQGEKKRYGHFSSLRFSLFFLPALCYFHRILPSFDGAFTLTVTVPPLHYQPFLFPHSPFTLFSLCLYSSLLCICGIYAGGKEGREGGDRDRNGQHEG